jgi:aminoglycoside 2'-N-acetyltransferase I
MAGVTELVIAHTAQLDPTVLDAARGLLEGVFEGDLTDDDWEHSLGGVHALVWAGAALVGHAALIQRRLLHRGRALRTGYVEGVGVRSDHRRRGHGEAMMTALEEVARAAYELGALSATDEGAAFYTAQGWLAWRGPTSMLTPTGIVRTEEEDGAIFVLPLSAPLNLHEALTCDWRDGDPW